MRKSTLLVVKEDEKTGERLSDAVFELASFPSGKAKTKRTNEQGLASFRILPCGRYVLRELTPPLGYEKVDTIFDVNADSCGEISVDGQQKRSLLVMNLKSENHYVRYLSNGGAGEYVETGMPSGTSYKIKGNVEVGIANPPQHFDFWNTKPDGSGTTYYPGDILEITEDLTLYAQWYVMYQVSYSNNLIPNKNFGQWERGEENYTIWPPSHPKLGYVNPGHRFVCWNDKPNGGGLLFNPGDILYLDKHIQLFAIWE